MKYIIIKLATLLLIITPAGVRRNFLVVEGSSMMEVTGDPENYNRKGANWHIKLYRRESAADFSSRNYTTK